MAYQVNLPSEANKGRPRLYTGNSTGCEKYRYELTTYFLIALIVSPQIIFGKPCIPPIIRGYDAYICSLSLTILTLYLALKQWILLFH